MVKRYGVQKLMERNHQFAEWNEDYLLKILKYDSFLEILKRIIYCLKRIEIYVVDFETFFTK